MNFYWLAIQFATRVLGMEMVKSRKRRVISDDQKAALAQGREQSRVIKRYLEAVATTRPKRGRKRTPESIRRQLTLVNTRLESASALNRLQLIQEKMNLEAELEQIDTSKTIKSLEVEFVKVAADYGQRKGISYQAWREAGVRPEVLRQAGIAETRTTATSNRT